jgi:hypothetical protein
MPMVLRRNRLLSKTNNQQIKPQEIKVPKRKFS